MTERYKTIHCLNLSWVGNRDFITPIQNRIGIMLLKHGTLLYKSERKRKWFKDTLTVEISGSLDDINAFKKDLYEAINEKNPFCTNPYQSY